MRLRNIFIVCLLTIITFMYFPNLVLANSNYVNENVSTYQLFEGEALEEQCKRTLSVELLELLQYTLNLMKYLAAIILFVFSVIDFIKAIVSQDNDALKKAMQTFIKRLIIAISIFFVSTIINYVFKITDLGTTTCGIK